MKIKIGQEGLASFSSGGTLIETGAIKFPKSVPVVLNSDPQKEVGSATNFTRDEEGNICAEIYVRREYVDGISSEKYSGRGLIEPMEFDRDSTVKVVTSALLRQVVLVPVYLRLV